MEINSLEVYLDVDITKREDYPPFYLRIERRGKYLSGHVTIEGDTIQLPPDHEIVDMIRRAFRKLSNRLERIEIDTHEGPLRTRFFLDFSKEKKPPISALSEKEWKWYEIIREIADLLSASRRRSD